MGSASKVVSVVLRISELICAIVVTSLVGRILYLLDLANASASSRLVYTAVISGLGIFISILLTPPLKYQFYAFPLDACLFICWIVAFGLLANLTGSNTCSSVWYWNYWGYYWGRYWVVAPRTSISAVTVGTSGCSAWRSTLAFSFIGAFCWLLSACLGLYWVAKYSDAGSRARSSASSHTPKMLKREKPHDVEIQAHGVANGATDTTADEARGRKQY